MEELPNGNNSSVSTSSEEMSAISVIPSEMLEKIMHFLPLTDLLKCREVSRKWKSAATAPTRNKCACIPFSRYICINERVSALKDFNNCAGVADGEFPVSRFHFTWNGDDRWLESIDAYDVTAVGTFFELVSPFVTELSMDLRMRVTPLSTNRPAIGANDYPKLTWLNVMVINDYDPYKPNSNELPPTVDNSAFHFLRGVIEKAPRMQNISLEIGSHVREKDTIPRCIHELGIRDNLKLLTSLSINTHFNRVDWESLISFKLKLKIFNLTLGQSHVDTNILKTFLETQATTLNNLTINYHTCIFASRVDAPQIVVDLPCLQKLKQLKITNISDSTTRTRLRCPTLSYQTQLPALKELCLRESFDQIQLQDFFSTNLAPLESLTQLNLPLISSVSGINLLKVVQIFPNITKLQLNHFDETNYQEHMRVIFENMTALEELSIPVSMVGYDSLITGLSRAECSKIKGPPSESFNRAIEKLDLPTTKTMACLENLKVLKLPRDSESWERNVAITEISGHVLKKMKSLKCLDFGVRKFPPLIGITLKEDLKKHGIKFIIRPPPHRRSKFCLTQPKYETDSESDEELPEYDDGDFIGLSVEENEEFFWSDTEDDHQQ